VVGHAEYTPVVFGPRRGDTSWAHQVATAAVFTAPLLTYGGHPENLLKSDAAEMIKSIPSTWDETIALPPSEIGELAVFARRKGDMWMLAAINGPQPRRFEVPCDFLGDPAYRALIVQEGSSGPASLNVHEPPERATRRLNLTLDLPAGGGFIARFTRDVAQ
jgi:alpha-glucosidase